MKSKRYQSAQEITRDIDAAKAKFDKYLELAAVQEGLGRIEEAKKYRVRARQIKDKKLDALKEKLAEFQTNLLPGVIDDGDRSIPASTRKSKTKPMQP